MIKLLTIFIIGAKALIKSEIKLGFINDIHLDLSYDAQSYENITKEEQKIRDQ
jgi:hypothetical protein